MQRHIFFGPIPLGPGEGPKDQILLNIIISITKSISKIVKPTFACLLTNERYMYKTYQTEFSFSGQGHAPGVGLGGTVGGWGGVKIVFPKFNQSWCVSYLHEWHMQWHKFLGPRP